MNFTPDLAERSVVTRILGNLGRLLSGKAAAGLLSLVYMAVAARALGPAGYGVLVIVHGYVMTIGGILEVSGWPAVVRYGAQALAQRDDARLTRLLALLSLIELSIGAGAVILAALIAPIVGPRLGWSPEAMRLAAPYALAVLASIRGTPAGYLQILGRFDLIGLQLMVAPLLRLAGAVVVALTQTGLTGFLIVWLIAALCEWLSMWGLGWRVARRTCRRAHLAGGLGLALRENPGLWRFMAAANADATLGELGGRIAPLIIGWGLGPAAAGLFAVAQRGTAVLAQPAAIFGQAAYAELAHVAAGGDSGRGVWRLAVRAIAIVLAVAAPVCLAIVLFGEPLAILVAGAAFAGAGPLMTWLALARALWLSAPPLSAALSALGRPWRSVWANVLGTGVTTALLPWWLTVTGLSGAGQYALVQAVVTVALLVVLLQHETAGRRLGEVTRARTT